MKKIKLLLATAALMLGGSVWAQTDVTSTYLTNADFSSTTAVTTDIYGYGKDGTPYGFQAVDGWTSVVTNADNSNASYPNSGMAAGVFAYGSSNTLRGGQKAAPATNPAGEATGNCFGFVGVWGCGGYYYQTVTLSAGKYTITVPMYNQSGTQANTTYTGFFPTSGTNQTVAVNPAVGSWANQTVTFTLTDDTEGQIRIGYQSTGSGSGSNPHIFIDCVKIEFTAIVVRDALQNAIAAAESVNSRINSSTLTAAIATAQGVYDNTDATQAEVNNAASVLNTEVEVAMSNHITNGGDATLALANADLSSLDGWTVASTSGYNDKGNGLIGDYNVRFSAATVDATHLNTEYCFGFEARWSGNYASYNQTTVALPAGVYTLTYDVENVNGATSNLTYADYNFVEVGGTKNYSTTTEWMAAKSGWTTHTIRVTLNDPAPITVSFGYGTGSNNTPADNTPALYVSHVNLAYSSFLDGAKAAWDEAKAAAEAAIVNTDYANVTGNELTALQDEIDKAEPTTVEGYNDATEALNNATAAFTAAAPKYDLYYAEKYNAERISTDITSSISDPATAAEAETAFQAILVGEYNYVATNFNANAAVKYGMTIDQWTGTATSGGNADTPQTNSKEKWGDAATTYYEQGKNGWGSSVWTLNYSITKTLPAGNYVLKIAARASTGTTAQLKATVDGTDYYEALPNFSSTGKGITTTGVASFDDADDFANSDAGYGWQWRYLYFEVATEGEVTLQIDASADSQYQWCSFGDVALISNVQTGALGTAYFNFDMKTLGFQTGEYAPYANTALLQAYADAHDILYEVTEPEDQAQVNALTATLNAAAWVQNTEDMDAIYNGNFAETGTGSNPKGWTRSNNGWGQQITGLTAEANGVAEGTTTAWYYNNNGAWQYGNDGVYTMPLAANQAYELSFKYRKHGSDWQNWMKASVLNSSDEGMEVVEFAAAEDGTTFVTAKAYFTTGAAGNYILSIEQYGNAHLTDVSLVKTSSTAFDLSDGTTYDPQNRTYYETVNFTRTIKAGYNTVCLPFDMTAEQVSDVFGTSAVVYEYEDVASGTNSTINFTPKTGNTIDANVPVLVGSATASVAPHEFTINDVVLKSGEAKVAGTNFDFVGTYAASTVIPDGDCFIGNGALYKSEGSTTIKPFRAYIHDKSGSGVKPILFIDDIETSIEEINGMEAENGVIYNLAGQRISKVQKGINIINGRKVLY